MDRHWAYCSACDRQVEVVVRRAARIDPSTGEPANEVICLEAGETCTGALCPLTEIPPSEMRAALDGADAAADPNGEE